MKKLVRSGWIIKEENRGYLLNIYETDQTELEKDKFAFTDNVVDFASETYENSVFDTEEEAKSHIALLSGNFSIESYQLTVEVGE